LSKSYNELIFELPKLDGRHTAKSFIEAIAGNRMDEAKGFLSKKLLSAGSVDLSGLWRIVSESQNFRCLNSAGGNRRFGGITKNSVLMMKDMQAGQLVHLYMVREPSKYGAWKIYGIESEAE